MYFKNIHSFSLAC